MKSSASGRPGRTSAQLRLVEGVDPPANRNAVASSRDGSLEAALEWFGRPLGDWSRYAACRGLPTDLFFPDGNDAEALQQTAVAKQICANCPVRRECLDYVLAIGRQDGIFGGTTEEEREARGQLALVETPG